MARKHYNGFSLETGSVALLAFNNPKVNIFSTKVLKDFSAAIAHLRFEPDVRVLVIIGMGSTFMAGGDIKELAGFNPEQAAEFSRLFHKTMDQVEKFPRPVIAGVNGYALGGGCELTLACDIVIASESAVFGQPEINIGIIPGAGGTKRLERRVGRLRAKELIFTGRKVKAEEAFNLGLANKVVSRDKFAEEVMVLAKTLAQKPVQCLEAAKELINAGTQDEEIKLFSKMFSYDDHKILMNEFIGKSIKRASHE